MEINGGMAVGIIVLIISLQFLFGALKEGGHLKAPKIGKRKSASSFRQYPLHPPVQGDGSDIEIY
jgi:uncharacterized membrane protein